MRGVECHWRGAAGRHAGGRVILADTSAWVEYDRATGSAVDRRLTELIRDEGPLAVTEPVLMEVMAGARDDEREQSPPSPPPALRSPGVRHGSRLRRRGPHLPSMPAAGRHARGMVDCLIASVARRHEATLLAQDVDMWRFAQVVGIQLDHASLRA